MTAVKNSNIPPYPQRQYDACQEYSVTYFKRISYPKKHIIFQIYGFQYYLSVVTMSLYQKRSIISNAMQYRKRTVLCEADKDGNVVQTIPFVNGNRDDDARSCPGTAVHASGAFQSLSYPAKIILASCTCFSDKTENNKRQIRNLRTKQRTVKSVFDGSKKLLRHPPGSNCLLCSVEAVSRCCRPIGSPANSLRAPAFAFEDVVSSLSATPTSG